MLTNDFIELVEKICDEALDGKNFLITGDSFFISVIEKQLILKLATINSGSISLIAYKPALSVRFFGGGHILVVDFFNYSRGLYQLQFLSKLDEILVFEESAESFSENLQKYILPLSEVFKDLDFVFMEI